MFKNDCSILLVDDENCARLLLGERISKLPGVIVSASLANGFSARKHLKEHVVDVVFTDIRMPLMDGLELAEFIKDFAPSCPVVIISGHEEFEYARKAIQYGVKEYLLKPITSKQIVEIVERCCKEVQEKREKLLLPQHYVYEQLEQEIYQTLVKGQAYEQWLPQLDKLMPQKGTVIRIELLEGCERRKEEISFIYRKLLNDCLSGNIVLRLTYTQEKFEYLVLPQDSEEHRSIKAMPEFLDRVLEQPVKWTEVGEVNSAKELAEKYTLFRPEDGKSQIEAACRYIEANLGKTITRDEVAEHIWLSPSYFSRLFKRIMGMGYNEYLTDMRIKKAKQMLLQNVSVADIAIVVGFRDARYFSIIFHKKTGYTPSEYRRAILTGEISQDES